MAARDISSPQHDANGTRLMVHARRVDDVRMSGIVAFKRLLRRTFCVRLGSTRAVPKGVSGGKFDVRATEIVAMLRTSTDWYVCRASITRR
jgi:hypothetical protein